MADRTAARMFGKVFNVLANHVPIKKAREVAKEFWEESGEYDFSAYQMDADEDLIILGLARKMTIEENEKEGTEGGIFYYGDDNF